VGAYIIHYQFSGSGIQRKVIATICWGVLKTGKKVDLERLKCNSTIGKMDLKDFNL
jgi:hypothetical protein